MNQPTHSKKQQYYTNDNIVESFRGLSNSVGKTVVKDVAAKIGSDALSSLLGSRLPDSGELKANQPIEIPKPYERQIPIRRPEVIRPPMIQFEEADLKQKIDAVRLELQALSKSLTSLHSEIQKSISDQIVVPGVYHLNFLERLKSILSAIRMDIDDSRTWLTSFTTRKSKRMYWGMYKKHGTSFGLSSERILATQAG